MPSVSLPAAYHYSSTVDLFTIVACPGNTLVDDRDFPKPILTPIELLLGLQGMTPHAAEFATAFFDLDLRFAFPRPRVA